MERRARGVPDVLWALLGLGENCREEKRPTPPIERTEPAASRPARRSSVSRWPTRPSMPSLGGNGLTPSFRKRSLRGSARLATWGLALLLEIGCTSSGIQVANYPELLRLTFDLEEPLRPGSYSVNGEFTLLNVSGGRVKGCFSLAWGVNLISPPGHSHGIGGPFGADHVSCVRPFKLEPGQELSWTESIGIRDLPAGEAKMNAWIQIVDPAAGCDRLYGCYYRYVSSKLELFQVTAFVGQPGPAPDGLRRR